MRSSRRDPHPPGPEQRHVRLVLLPQRRASPIPVAEPRRPSREVPRSASLIVLRQPIASQNPVTLPYVYV